MPSLDHEVSFSTVSIQPLRKNIGKRIQEGQRKSIEPLSRRTPLPTFIPVLGDLVTLLNQNLVKREVFENVHNA